MQEVLASISDRGAHTLKSSSATLFSQYIERTTRLKELDALYDATAANITRFWRLWISEGVSITKVMSLGREVSRSI